MPKSLSARATLVAAACAIFVSESALADAARKVSIPAGNLRQALLELSKDYGAELLYQPEEVKHYQTGGVRGTYTAPDAVRILLKGTSLELQTDSSGAMAIVPQDTRARTTGPAQLPGAQSGKEGKRSSSPGFRLAQTDRTPAAGNDAVTNGETGRPAATGSAQLEEVVVTAEKRAERLLDVPVPVTSISASGLAQSSQVRIQDYYSSVPGLNISPGVSSEQILAIRGITTGAGTNPTVGIAVDDVPFGASTNLGGGNAIPDIDPGDLARIEVLRGPQGTLYGADSMGGLLKFVTVNPSTNALEARLQIGEASIQNGARIGYNARGSVNAPLSDSVAVRASAFTQLTPGYIDNPVSGVEGANEARASGGRIAGLWKISEDWSLKLSALYQVSRANGSNEIDVLPGLKDLQQNYIAGTGGFDRKVQVYSAVVRGKVGAANLISVTGYNINRYSDSFDYSYALGPLTGAIYGVTGTPLIDNSRANKVSQELRLSGALGTHLGWLLGGFYTNESSHWAESLLATDPSTAAVVAQALYLSFPQTYSEAAGFGDLTWYITDRLDVQFGGRDSEIRETSDQLENGPYTSLFVPGATPPLVYPTAHAKSNAFTYLVTPRLKVTPNLMLYGRIASGYRAGGPNLSPGGVVPDQYAPDRTKNYELGLKGDFLDHRLAVDSSLYYIDWSGIQLHLINPTTDLAYTVNGSRAKSEGIEFSVQGRPVSWATLSAWVVWDDAVLTQDLPLGPGAAYGVSGDRLPYSSRFSGDLSLDVDFPLTAEWRALAGASINYVGDRLSAFNSLVKGNVVPRQDLPAYARTDLHAGARFRGWTFTAYVTNLTDRRGILNGGVGYTPPYGFVIIQPRTVGVSVTKVL